MKQFRPLVALAAFAIATPLAAVASPLLPITGSDSIGFIGVSVSPGGSTLNTSGISLSWVVGQTQGYSSGNLGIPILTQTSGDTTLHPYGTDGGRGSPFTISFGSDGDYGTFVETSNPLIVASSATGENSSNLTVYLLGTYTPGSLNPGIGGTADFDIAFTETAGSYSGSGTFSTPAVSLTPEPSSLVLLSTGLLGTLGAVRRRFKR